MTDYVDLDQPIEDIAIDIDAELNQEEMVELMVEMYFLLGISDRIEFKNRTS